MKRTGAVSAEAAPVSFVVSAGRALRVTIVLGMIARIGLVPYRKDRNFSLTLLSLFLAAACFAQTAPTVTGTLRNAEAALFAARYQTAAQLYREAIQANPGESAAYYGLVRALIADHHSAQAYTVAEKALLVTPQTAATQTAAGLAAYRRGNLGKAEQYFQAALQMDAGYAGALQGLADVNESVSRYRTAREQLLSAYAKSPGDPELIVAYANTRKGAEHIAALQKALAILDPDTEKGRNLRAHIATDIALGDRKVRQLVSPAVAARIKLIQLMDGPRHKRGLAVQVQLNRKQTVRLMLDTGASGISVSRKVVERAGLEQLGDQPAEAKGIGDDPAPGSYSFLAPELRIGDVEFANFPVTVFQSARTTNYDGLIGADVFQDFMVTIDFPRFEISLTPYADGRTSVNAAERPDAAPPAQGFHRVFRFGNLLTIPTEIKGGATALFLLDSGASTNCVDAETVGPSAAVSSDGYTRVIGVQGEVKKTGRANYVTLTFAGLRQDNPSLIVFSLEKVSDAIGVTVGGLLGLPALGLLKLTVDYREGAVRLESGK